MADDEKKKFKLTDIDVEVTVKKVEPPKPPAEVPLKPNYLVNILAIALIFETILIVTFAAGDGGPASARADAHAWLQSSTRIARSTTIRVLVRERNAVLRRAATAGNEADERAWRLASKILNEAKDEIADRLKTLLDQPDLPARVSKISVLIWRLARNHAFVLTITEVSAKQLGLQPRPSLPFAAKRPARLIIPRAQGGAYRGQGP